MAQSAESADHQLVADFFAGRGLVAERIPEATTKTPDFRILRGAEIVGYCEVKSVQDVFAERVHDAIVEARGGHIEIGYGNDYRQGRCLARFATKATAQFSAVNPAHSVPNILLVVNHDSFAVLDDFQQIITGYAGALQVGKPLRDDFPEIDVYVWMNVVRGVVGEVHRRFRHENALKETARDLLQLE